MPVKRANVFQTDLRSPIPDGILQSLTLSYRSFRRKPTFPSVPNCCKQYRATGPRAANQNRQNCCCPAIFCYTEMHARSCCFAEMFSSLNIDGPYLEGESTKE